MIAKLKVYSVLLFAPRSIYKNRSTNSFFLFLCNLNIEILHIRFAYPFTVYVVRVLACNLKMALVDTSYQLVDVGCVRRKEMGCRGG
jgi:hypothetical protein